MNNLSSIWNRIKSPGFNMGSFGCDTALISKYAEFRLIGETRRIFSAYPTVGFLTKVVESHFTFSLTTAGFTLENKRRYGSAVCVDVIIMKSWSPLEASSKVIPKDFFADLRSINPHLPFDFAQSWLFHAGAKSSNCP